MSFQGFPLVSFYHAITRITQSGGSFIKLLQCNTVFSSHMSSDMFASYVLLHMWHIGGDPDVLLQCFLWSKPITYLSLRLLVPFHKVLMNAEEKQSNCTQWQLTKL